MECEYIIIYDQSNALLSVEVQQSLGLIAHEFIKASQCYCRYAMKLLPHCHPFQLAVTIISFDQCLLHTFPRIMSGEKNSY